MKKRPSLGLLVRTLTATFAMGFCGTCDQLSRFIQSFGYTEMRPPSTLLAPGTMVRVKSAYPFEADIICTAEESLGPDLQLIRSETARSSTRARSEMGFRLNVNALEQVKTEQQLKDLKSITASLDNPVILTLTDTIIYENLHRRKDSCRSAIAARIANGDKVTMISSVIMGDMTMKMAWDKTNTSQGGATVPALQNLALAYGISASSVKDSQVSASGLIWGVLDDAFLASLTIDEMDTNQIPRGQREIGVNYATFIERNDGKVVMKGHIPPAAPSPGGRGRNQGAALIRRQAPGLAGITAAELMDTHTHLAPYLAPEGGDDEASEEAGVYLLEPAGHHRLDDGSSSQAAQVIAPDPPRRAAPVASRRLTQSPFGPPPRVTAAAPGPTPTSSIAPSMRATPDSSGREELRAVEAIMPRSNFAPVPAGIHPNAAGGATSAGGEGGPAAAPDKPTPDKPTPDGPTKNGPPATATPTSKPDLHSPAASASATPDALPDTYFVPPFARQWSHVAGTGSPGAPSAPPTLTSPAATTGQPPPPTSTSDAPAATASAANPASSATSAPPLDLVSLPPLTAEWDPARGTPTTAPAVPTSGPLKWASPGFFSGGGLPASTLFPPSFPDVLPPLDLTHLPTTQPQASAASASAPPLENLPPPTAPAPAAQAKKEAVEAITEKAEVPPLVGAVLQTIGLPASFTSQPASTPRSPTGDAV